MNTAEKAPPDPRAALNMVAPDDIPANIPAITGLAGERQIGPFHVAFLPLWLTVRVPRNAEPGIYAGELVASADGEKTVRVPVQFRVAGHWALPDPVEFKTMVGMVESPDSVAMQYGVKMWSAEHWKMLDQVFALMGEVGVGDLYIPLLAKTNLANDDSMVRWIKQADGSYKHDFSIVERYLDLALKHLGRKCLVVLWINDYPFFRSGAQNWAGKSVNLDDVSAAREANTLPLPYTELNPETGLMTEKQAPQWGTPEAKTFWKPVFDGITAALAKRGMEKNMLFGCFTDGNIYPKCVAVCSELAPQAKWYARTHHMGNYYEAKKYNGYFNWGCWVPAADDVMVVNWTPDTGTSEYYRWRMPMWKTSIPTVTGAWSMNQNSELPIFRMMAESILLGNAGEGPIKTGDMVHGIGCQGADFWPVLVTDTDKRGKSLATQIRKSRLSMYTDQGGVMDQSSATFAFLGRGKNGPVATYHLRLLQEAQQDMEARIFVQDALLDHTDKLGPDLARRCKDICDDRTRQLHHYSNCMMSTYHRIFPRDIFDDGWYRRNTGELYALTDEVAKALGK